MSLFIIIFLFSVGFISYKFSNSYALFSDSVEGTKTIEATVKLSNLDKSGANEPVLDSSMIPVYYDSNNDVWRKADVKNHNEKYKWYDYDNKMWANSVTVSSTNRSKYQSAALGTEIPMDDILTMEVWIPRYKYKVFNYNADGTKTSSPQEIEITFEKDNKNTSEITCSDSISGTDGKASETCKLKSTNATCTDSLCNNKTYTHPGFTFGDEQLNGFWVGKFELTGTINNITTKPNLSSIRNQTISSFSSNIMKMKDSGNNYGLSTNTDTHMIKNSEWGAVAYLSHSKYGTCTSGSCEEVSINNSSSYITGRSAGVPGSSSVSASSEGTYTYEQENGVKASTTSNIYGVYDMSGGIWEYTMSNIINSDGKTMITSNSGFSTYPDAKYYDKYSYSTSGVLRIRSKLGDGIKEVYNTDRYGWYGDSSYLGYASRPWFMRGGGTTTTGSEAGLFYSYYYYGAATTSYGTRLAIASN